MELVTGVPITEYCDANELRPLERLELFLTVCAAVQHAHQKGVIHRDLKPSNILVTLHDGQPVPKVIDFGTAKALQQPLTARTLFTAYGKLIGTPQYMSPEQAELSGLDVDTRADIYSLGVLLYELLTGTTPFEADRLRAAAFDELLRILRQEEPPKPSTRISTLGERATVIARRRQVDPALLRRTVQGDLDWIVMKALEKDRTRRYETASAFAEDIHRHLAHEPVRASPPSAAYRTGKFIQRHRLGVGMTAAIMVVLTLGLIGTVMTLQQTRRERDRAVRAEAEAKTVASLLQVMLNSVKPEQTKGKDTTLLRQMLDHTAAHVDHELKCDPLTEARVRTTFGEVYLALGDYPKAETMFRRSLQLREASLDKEHPDTLDSVHNLGWLLTLKGDHAAAEALLRRALEARERTLGRDHPNTLASLLNLANLLYEKADYAGAELLFRRALEANERTLGKEDRTTLGSLNNLASLLASKGDYAAAAPLFRQALEARERTLGKEHPDTLASMRNLARVLTEQGDYAAAEPLLRQALEARERTLGQDHPDTLSSVMGLARLLAEKGDSAGAEQLERRALEGSERTLGKEHPATLTLVNNLAISLGTRGDYAGAETLFRQALEAQERTLGRQHPDTLRSLHNLAWLFDTQGDYDRAEPLYRQALAGRERAQGPNHPETLSSLTSLAQLLEAKRDYAGAEAIYRQKWEERRNALGPDHPATLSWAGKSARMLQARGDLAGAEPLFRQLLTTSDPKAVKALNDIAWPLATSADPKLRDGPTAVQFAEKAAELSNRKDAALLDTLAAAYAEAGQFTNAINVQREAVALLQTEAQRKEYAVRVKLYAAGIAYHDDADLATRGTKLLNAGNFSEATPLLQDCLTIRAVILPDDWRTFSTRSQLAGCWLAQKKFNEAEPLLLAGYAGMKQRESQIPLDGRVRLKEAIQRLIQLYEATDRPQQAAEWKQKLANFEVAEAPKPPTTSPGVGVETNREPREK